MDDLCDRIQPDLVAMRYLGRKLLIFDRAHVLSKTSNLSKYVRLDNGRGGIQKRGRSRQSFPLASHVEISVKPKEPEIVDLGNEDDARGGPIGLLLDGFQ